LPVVAIVFGSVTPPQGDVVSLRVHLGQTNEVSSFDCLLQNFDKKYSPGSANEIIEGVDSSISIGRGANCPLIATVRVEEVRYLSSPVDNYLRVKGRCWGERLFRRVVTKTYENKKGEEIVKDLIDYYVGLSHVRDSTELIENTDTTYTLLEYENTPVFDILKYIASTADKAGVIGFDFRVEPDGKFAFFPRNSKTSPVSLSERIEVSEYRKDIHRIRNRVTVYGAAEKALPTDKDAWTESANPNVESDLDEDAVAGQPVVSVVDASLFSVGDKVLIMGDSSQEDNVVAGVDTVNNDLTMQNNLQNTYTVYWGSKVIRVPGWYSGTGCGNIYGNSAEEIVRSYCVEHRTETSDHYGNAVYERPADDLLNLNLYPSLTFQIKEQSAFDGNCSVRLTDNAGNTVSRSFTIRNDNQWQLVEFRCGKKHSDEWTHSVFNSGDFDWENVKRLEFFAHFPGTGTGSFWIDNLFLDKRRWEATQEDSTSQSNYGLRELVEVDEELHSDNECSLRAKALLAHLKDPAEYLTLRSTVIDYGTNPILPGDKIHVTLPNENIDADYRIISVEYHVIAREQTLEITLELGKETPLLADYLYDVRRKTASLSRYKVGR
jgi:hypothetical protein